MTRYPNDTRPLAGLFLIAAALLYILVGTAPGAAEDICDIVPEPTHVIDEPEPREPRREFPRVDLRDEA